MANPMNSLSLLKLHPNAASFPHKTKGFLSSSPFPSQLSDPISRHRPTTSCTDSTTFSSKALRLAILSPCARTPWSRSMLAFASSHEDSKHSEIGVDKEQDDLKLGVDESQEAWKKALASFKEQALKMQGVSQEAYELYSKKALVILKETSEQLKIQADKATHDLSVIAKEIGEEGKEYLSTATQNSPDEVREIVETFTSSDNDLSEISRIQDFYFGIPYGLVLSLGGFISFMLTGSTAAIRFGVILGGILLALSISSLRSYKRGKSFPSALKGQAGISATIFLREIRLLFQRPSFVGFLTTFVSGAMLAFYIYKITLNGGSQQGSSLKRETQN